MKKNILLLLLLAASIVGAKAQIYMAKNGAISFHSDSPLEDIDGKSKTIMSLFNTSSRDMMFTAKIKSFDFKNQLMKEHFNENYLESDKYPDATYKGKVNETIDFTKDGAYPVTTTGKMNIHGVERDITEKGTLTISGGGKNILIHCEMMVRLVDYKIEIPKLVVTNIAEVIAVKIDIAFVPYVKEEKK